MQLECLKKKCEVAHLHKSTTKLEQGKRRREHGPLEIMDAASLRVTRHSTIVNRNTPRPLLDDLKHQGPVPEYAPDLFYVTQR
jgi:hypothetical protein